MKKALMIITGLLTILLTGCWSAKDLNMMSIVLGIGIDQTAELNRVQITTQVVKPEAIQSTSAEGGKGGGKAYTNISMSGETLFEAIRNTTHLTGKKLFFTHCELIVFGKSLAGEGLENAIDFLLRDHELRPTALVAVTTDKVADIFNMESESEKVPASNILKTLKAYQNTSQFKSVTLFQLTEQLKSETTAPVLPLIATMENEGGKKVGVSGMAVFKRAKMVGTLNETETRGLLWIQGNVKEGIIVIDSPESKGKFSLEITKATSKIEPEVKGNQIIMHINITEDATLGEQTNIENLANVNSLKVLEKLQADAIRQEILAALKKSRELNADIFGFGDIVYKNYPDQWQPFRDQWEQVYPGIDCVIDIETKIRSTGTLSDVVYKE